MGKRAHVLLPMLILCAGCGAPRAQQPAGEPEGRQVTDAQIAELTDRIIDSQSELAYFSDYFSFVGRDAQGHVAFAIDNNRGRDGGEFQAEHFVILHDEQQGFIDLPGFSRYANPSGELRGIPDSEFFAFEGARRTGLTIRSKQTPLELAIGPLELKVGRAIEERAIFYMGSAPATLKWGSRTLQGRVIEEYLVVKDWNRISRSQLGLLFKSISFQGLYLMTPDAGDLYVHRIDGGFTPLGDSIARLGFYAEAGAAEETQGLEIAVQRKEQGLGFFRWPVAWTARWQTPGRGAGVLEVETADFKRVGAFLLGGFGMGIVKGTLEQGGKKLPVYGWSELILWRP